MTPQDLGKLESLLRCVTSVREALEGGCYLHERILPKLLHSARNRDIRSMAK